MLNYYQKDILAALSKMFPDMIIKPDVLSIVSCNIPSLNISLNASPQDLLAKIDFILYSRQIEHFSNEAQIIYDKFLKSFKVSGSGYLYL